MSEVKVQGHRETKCMSQRRHTFRRSDVEAHLFSWCFGTVPLQ